MDFLVRTVIVYVNPVALRLVNVVVRVIVLRATLVVLALDVVVVNTTVTDFVAVGVNV